MGPQKPNQTVEILLIHIGKPLIECSSIHTSNLQFCSVLLAGSTVEVSPRPTLPGTVVIPTSRLSYLRIVCSGTSFGDSESDLDNILAHFLRCQNCLRLSWRLIRHHENLRDQLEIQPNIRLPLVNVFRRVRRLYGIKLLTLFTE